MFKTLILSLSLASLSLAESKGPTYHCENVQKEVIDIFFKDQKALVKRISKDGKSFKEWVLPGFVAFNDSPREPIRYVYRLPETGKKIDWRNSFEIREQFFRELKPQELRMMLIQEGEVLAGWKCFYHGAALTIKMLENAVDSSRADLLFVTRGVKGFLAEDKLTEESVGMLIQAVERYALWGAKGGTVFQPIVYLSPAMLRQVEDRLSELGKGTWQTILKSVSYDSFPPIQRWVFWINLASRNNNEAVRAGVRSFVKSPLYSDKNMQAFVIGETKAAVQSLPQNQIRQIVRELKTEKEKTFLEAVYKDRAK